MEAKVIVFLIVFNHLSFCKSECPTGEYRIFFTCVPCHPNCLGGSCNSMSGNCDRCLNGFYGTGCAQRCMDNCDECSDDKTCHKCSKGFYPSDQNTCIRCSTHCYDRECSQTDGTCVNGCDRNRWYGALCDSFCPLHCKNGFCNQYDVKCCNGCKEGYYGPRCLHRKMKHREVPMQTMTTALPYSITEVVEDEKPVELTPQTTKTVTLDVNKKSETSVKDESWYLYVVMGVCLLVTVLILVTCVGYIIHSRKKLSKMSEMKNTPSVVYSREYNYIDYSDSTNSLRTQDAIYFEPLPDSMYDYITNSNSVKRDVTVRSNPYDSDGYMKPTNQNRHYITAVHDKNKSPDVKTSNESLKHNGTVEHSYNG